MIGKVEWKELTPNILVNGMYSAIRLSDKWAIMTTTMLIGCLDKMQEEALCVMDAMFQDFFSPIPGFSRDVDVIKMSK